MNVSGSVKTTTRMLKDSYLLGIFDEQCQYLLGVIEKHRKIKYTVVLKCYKSGNICGHFIFEYLSSFVKIRPL